LSFLTAKSYSLFTTTKPKLIKIQVIPPFSSNCDFEVQDFRGERFKAEDNTHGARFILSALHLVGEEVPSYL
jgi:hypothetical protein